MLCEKERIRRDFQQLSSLCGIDLKYESLTILPQTSQKLATNV